MEQPPINGKLISKSWEQWKSSEEGSRCLDASILYSQADRKHLENRLWYAFMAGQRSMESNNQ